MSRDLNAAMSVFAQGAVLVTERFGRFEGQGAIRGYFEDWLASFDDLLIELEDAVDLGNGVVFAPQVVTGHYAGSSAEARLRNAAVYEFTGGLVERSTTYVDVDAARAAAERLAQERG